MTLFLDGASGKNYHEYTRAFKLTLIILMVRLSSQAIGRHSLGVPMGAKRGDSDLRLACCSTSASVDLMCWNCLGNRLNKLFLFGATWMHYTDGLGCLKGIQIHFKCSQATRHALWMNCIHKAAMVEIFRAWWDKYPASGLPHKLFFFLVVKKTTTKKHQKLGFF